MNLFFRIHADMSFTEWLQHNYHETPDQIMTYMLHTGSERDFEKMMFWYRRRYEMELRQIKAVSQVTIKSYMEGLKHDGVN